jgi:hypothetical protein
MGPPVMQLIPTKLKAAQGTFQWLIRDKLTVQSISKKLSWLVTINAVD